MLKADSLPPQTPSPLGCRSSPSQRARVTVSAAHRHSAPSPGSPLSAVRLLCGTLDVLPPQRWRSGKPRHRACRGDGVGAMDILPRGAVWGRRLLPPPPPLALGEGCVASPWSPLAPHTVSGSGQEPVPEGLYSSHVSEQLPTKAGVCLHPTHRSPWDQCGRAKPLTSLAQGPESNKEELKRHVE